MPSIEILCVEPHCTVACDTLPFAVAVSAGRRSHRAPHPRFQADFDASSGMLYHLGNPGCGHDGYFFAYDLLEHDDENEVALRFVPGVAPAVRTFIERLLDASTIRTVLFTTDWQFGPPHTLRLGVTRPRAFWSDHDQGRLLLNAAYTITDAD